MAEPVAWSPDGTPHSPRFGDIYRSGGAALAQARHVFLAGCGLPAAWAGARQWRVLETGFGLGLNFLAAWRAWKDDPARPGLLHFSSVEAHPVGADDLVRSAQADPELLPLAHQLARQWWGLVPGVHRLAFEDGRVLLTLAIGDARESLLQQAFAADSVFLDGFEPARNPAIWELPTLKAVARLCRRGTRVATWTVAGQVRRDLQQCGFLVDRRPGLPPKRDALAGTFEPAWQPRGVPAVPREPSSALVIGAGIAGAAAGASLARRGWQVQVLDAADAPASGASALPAGLLAPHASPDDNLLSRLSRPGVRMTLRECELRLHAGEDWAPSGAIERRPDGRPAADLGDAGEPWQIGRPDGLWHRAAAWIKPASLVRAWLAAPGVQWVAGARVAALSTGGSGWRVTADDGRQWDAALVVVATALGTATLLPVPLRLHAVRGQVSWDLHAASGIDPDATPVNGNGHFLPAVPLGDEGLAWLSGSTYVRGDLSTEPRRQEHLANLERLRTLVPDLASSLAPRFETGAVRAWCGVRCASTDRRPLVGQVLPGLCVSTAMGSRGLTFAHLAAELLAAWLHGEPSPLPVRLAQALDVRRQLGEASAPTPGPAGP